MAYTIISTVSPTPPPSLQKILRNHVISTSALPKHHFVHHTSCHLHQNPSRNLKAAPVIQHISLLENRQGQSESSLLRGERKQAVDSVGDRVYNSSGSHTASASCIKTDELAALETTKFRLHHVLQGAPVGHKREALIGNNLASWVDASRGHSARHSRVSL